MARLVWVRNCNAANVKRPGSGIEAQVIHDEVCVAHLDVIASIELSATEAGLTLRSLMQRYPAPKLGWFE